MFAAKVAQVAEITAGRLKGSGDVAVRGVTTDSRQATPGQLFVALRGEKHDGHDFVQAAAEKGAAAAVVEREVPSAIPQVIVDDTLRALGLLGRWWREQQSPTVVAVTGSAGKTTTKGMIAAILERVGPTLCNPGTENNEIGVPRTLLRLGGERFCVLEMGSRGLGQIAYLVEIAWPNIGVITNIGEAHLGLMGGREKVAQAKGELVVGLPEDGVAVLNADDHFFGVLAQLSAAPVVSFGLAAGDYTAEGVRVGLDDARFVLCTPGGRREVSLPVGGRHNVLNALAAAAAAEAAGASLEHVAMGLEGFRPEAMRAEVIRLADGTVVINDAYNASPTSVAAALELLGAAEGRKVLVFGDMLELGEYAQEAHERVGRLAAEAGVALMMAVGKLAKAAGEEAERRGVDVVYADDAGQAAAMITDVLRRGDVVLVKASRLVGLERVVEALKGEDEGG